MNVRRSGRDSNQRRGIRDADHLVRFTVYGKPAAFLLALAATSIVAACGGAASPIETAERVDLPSARSVALRVRLQPDHAAQAARYVSAARATLTAYATRFAPAPFTSLTIVDPDLSSRQAPRGDGAIAIAPTRWLAPALAMEPETAVTRAVGSAFWHALLSCTAADDWFIDGVNEYTSTSVIAAQFPAKQTDDPVADLQIRYFAAFVPRVLRVPLGGRTAANGLAVYRAHPKIDVHHLMPDERASAVAKTSLALGTLEGWVGSPTWDAVLAEFAARHWAVCPSPADLEHVATDVTGLDLSWFFREAFETSDVFDYAVDRIISTRDGPSEPYRTSVVVRRLGEAEFTGTSAPPAAPFESGRGVELLVRFDDGSERVDRWDGRDRWKTFVYESAGRARSAEVDPRHVLLLDVNRTNNSVTLAPVASRAAIRWTARWSLWLQDLLLTSVSLW
jgi:hypothetical protein